MYVPAEGQMVKRIVQCIWEIPTWPSSTVNSDVLFTPHLKLTAHNVSTGSPRNTRRTTSPLCRALHCSYRKEKHNILRYFLKYGNALAKW